MHAERRSRNRGIRQPLNPDPEGNGRKKAQKGTKTEHEDFLAACEQVGLLQCQEGQDLAADHVDERRWERDFRFLPPGLMFSDIARFRLGSHHHENAVEYVPSAPDAHHDGDGKELHENEPYAEKG
jgi:hypothetical protein